MIGIFALLAIAALLVLLLWREIRDGNHLPPTSWALAFLLLAAPALAQERTPGASEVRNAGPATVGLVAGATVTMTGGGETAVMPIADVAVDGPLVLGKRTIARTLVRIGIGSAPGGDVSFSDVATFRTAELGFGSYYVVGRSTGDGQDFIVALIAEAGFGTRLATGERTPDGALLRHFGFGLLFTERTAGNSLTLLYRPLDEVTGDRGFGVIALQGGVGIPGTEVGAGRARVVLIGSASVPLGPTWLRQRPVFRLGLAVGVGPRR